MDVMPKWADVVLIPLISLFLAAVLSALVILGIGEDPIAHDLHLADKRSAAQTPGADQAAQNADDGLTEKADKGQNPVACGIGSPAQPFEHGHKPAWQLTIFLFVGHRTGDGVEQAKLFGAQTINLSAQLALQIGHDPGAARVETR